MTYHFPGEERRRGDRRQGGNTAYAGPERRVGPRRRRREPVSNKVWFLSVSAILLAVDQVAWQGAGLHAIVGWFNDHMAGIRAWSANVWTYGS